MPGDVVDTGGVQGEESDEKVMEELGDLVAEAREASSELFSAAVKLYGLCEMFAGKYLSGENVDYFGPLIHNAFTDHDDTKAGLEDVLDLLWAFLEEHGVVHSPPKEVMDGGDLASGDLEGVEDQGSAIEDGVHPVPEDGSSHSDQEDSGEES